MSIYFYKVAEPYGCFSNFSYHGFQVDGKFWRTSEHYFQAQKFVGTLYEEEIRNVDTAIQAAKMGRDRKRPLRKDWEEVKDDIMRKAVLNKFMQNEDIKKVLLETKEQEIIEQTTTDYYWGCGDDGTGKNMLGKILMEVRESLNGGE